MTTGMSHTRDKVCSTHDEMNYDFKKVSGSLFAYNKRVRIRLILDQRKYYLH